jgi:hypothetical protein
MLEILLIRALSKKIAATAMDKGRSPTRHVVLFVVLWAGGEFSGAVAAAIYGTVTAGAGEPGPLVVYSGALLGAALGAVLGFVVVNRVSEVRDEFPLLDRKWPDRDYKKRFGEAVFPRDEITTEPDTRPRSEDERYRAE